MSNTKTIIRVIEISALTRLERMVDKANRTCEKLGIPAITLQVLRKISEVLPNNRLNETVEVQIVGQQPKLSGWALVGVLSPIQEESGNRFNLVCNIPGETVPSEYRTMVGTCDHCNLVRRRSETFVLKNENGNHKMVGRTCLKDFLGHSDVETMVSIAEFWILLWKELEEPNECTNDVWAMKILPFLEYAASVVSSFGWVSKRRAEESNIQSTASMLEDFLIFGKSKSSLAVSEENKIFAKKCLDYFETLVETESDYLYNLTKIAQSGYVTRKTFGLACSMANAYNVELDRAKPKRLSAHIGTVGAKFEALITVKAIIAVNSIYGTSGLHKLEDVAGNQIVWFATGSNWLEVGQNVMVNFTVKEHATYNGEAQTTVKLLKVGELKKPKKKQLV